MAAPKSGSGVASQSHGDTTEHGLRPEPVAVKSRGRKATPARATSGRRDTNAVPVARAATSPPTASKAPTPATQSVPAENDWTQAKSITQLLAYIVHRAYDSGTKLGLIMGTVTITLVIGLPVAVGIVTAFSVHGFVPTAALSTGVGGSVWGGQMLRANRRAKREAREGTGEFS